MVVGLYSMGPASDFRPQVTYARQKGPNRTKRTVMKKVVLRAWNLYVSLGYMNLGRSF